ncbi:MAG: hypothetical protein R3248_07565 [Candidatus Promineifilaceae bacterium]|nr:hypothetical protein [Candidatus Promineifilaceae bacterium]
MKKTLVWLIGLLLLGLLAGCGEAPVAEVPVEIPDFVPASVGDVPADIPVSTAAADVQIGVTDSSTHVRYLADSTDVDVLVDYYDDALAAEGWEASELEDVTVRADTETTATLVRVNDAGDTITVDVAHQDGEDNTEVEVVVVRADP